MWNDDDRKWLYQQMKSHGVDTGSYTDFTKSLENKDDRDWYYQKSRDLGLNVGSTKDFYGMMVQPTEAAPKPTTSKPKATAQVDTQVNAQVKPINAAPAKQEKQKLTTAEMVGLQMQAGGILQHAKKSQQDFSTRMENMRKGNTLGAANDMKMSPATGKMERKFYTTGGDEVGSQWEQSGKNLQYRDAWEATTPEGAAHREQRMQSDYEGRVGAVMDKFDPNNAAELAWKNAEARTAADREKHNNDIWSNFAASGGGRENRAMATGEMTVSNMADHLTHHDLQRMADDAWNALGKDKQQAITDDLADALHTRYPQATDEQIRQVAGEMARQQSDQRLFELAVKKNAPKSATDWFFRKAIGQNSLVKLQQGLARSIAGTTGDWQAREVAEAQYDHGFGRKAVGIAGTVVGFAADPLTVISAGTSGLALKGGMWLGGKAIGEAATRKFATTLAGRLASGVVGGAVNFGTFEAGSETVEQLKWGGLRDENGAVGDYSAGAVGKRFGHGLLMGSATGVISPLFGNVSDKLVRATESTAGKMAVHAGEIGVGTVAEGTIFSVPEWIEGKRGAMDVWTDNMAMMAGFKLQHGLKSAPKVIAELASDRQGRKAGFETRLRSALDGSRPDLALTKDEKAELERGGYTDLTELTEDYERYEAKKAEQNKGKGQKPNTTDPNRMIEEGELPEGVTRDIPYNRFEELMNDGSISEAARAKMYYYLTGHTLPMSTILGSTMTENKDADGNVNGYTVQSFGANGVVTSRKFADKKRADVEANRINRQAELNTIDVGERHFDWKGDNQRMWDACQAVADEVGAPANRLYELMKRKPESMNEVELEWAKKIMEAHDKLGDKYGSSEVRTDINKEFGVDVDKAIKREPNRRSVQEQKAVDEYAKRLFADVETGQEEASKGDPTGQNTSAAALFGMDDDTPSDPMAAAHQRGHEADMQGRRDIAIERAANPDNTEAEMAWDGVVERINDDADYIAAQKRNTMQKMQHADGMIRPAVMKETDEEGHNKVMYVVDGTVTMLDDGSRVDPTRSDKSVVVYDPTTGKRQIIDPGADTGILSLGTTTSGADYDAMIESDREQYVQDQIDEAQGKVHLAPGMQIVLPTGESATVMAMDGDNVTVGLGDGTQTNVSLENLQRISDEKALADYNQRHGIEPEQGEEQTQGEGQEEAPTLSQETAQGDATQSGVVAGAPTEFAPDMELTVRDENGSEKPAMVMGRVRYENGSFVPDENGSIIEYYMDGEVKHDHEGVLRDKVVSHVVEKPTESAESVQEAGESVPNSAENVPETGMNVPENGENVHDTAESEQNPTELWLHGKLGAKEYLLQIGYFPEWVNEQTDEKLLEEAAYVAKKNTVAEEEQKQKGAPAESVVPSEAQAETEDHVEQAQPSEAQPMPMLDNGEEDWHAVTPERAHQYIYNEAGLSRSEGNQFVAANVDAAQKTLDKAMAVPMPQVGTSIQKYNQAKAKRQEKIDEAQKALDYWKGVRDIQNGIQQEENERQAAADAERHEEANVQEQADNEAHMKAEDAQQDGADAEGGGGNEAETKNGSDGLRNDGQGRTEGRTDQRQGDLAEAEDVDNNGHRFITSSNGNTIFGQITEDSGLTAAPIKLSEGFNVVDEKGNNHGYGLLHIEAGHGQQILEAGYASVQDFVEDVTKNYQEIRIARSRKGNETYMLLELHDEKHKRTLYVELSNDGTYWNVNSGGIFKNKYTDKNDIVQPEPTVRSNANTDTAEVVDSPAEAVKGETVDRGGNSSQTISSESKISQSSARVQGNGEKSAENSGVAPYTIEPTTYTNKKGKTTEMHLVKFNGELTKEQKNAGKELAKENRGWWDAKQGGFMMRSEEAAKELAEALGSEEAVQDAQPMSAKDMEAANDKGAKGATGKKAKTAKKPKAANRVEAADQTEEQPKAEHQQEEAKEEPKQETKAKSKWVDDEDAERFEELRKRLRMKLRGQLNMGIDPEAFSIGVEMSFLMLKHGARKFSEYAKNMIEALGEDVRPYLKSFYNGARDLPEMEDFEKELTPYEEVRAFDVKNFDKEGAKDLVATAEHIAKEHAVEQEAKEATNKLKSQRNEQRKEADEQRAADTTALAREGETTASEAESQLASEGVEQGADEIAEGIDDELDKVNDQLALLGYYEADHVKKDYNEATGYMRNAEKKAVKDAANLASSLIDDLGLDREEATHGAPGKNGKRKTKPLAVANIAPAGGDITMHLPLAEGRELYMNISLFPSAGKDVAGYEGDNLEVDLVMWRVENPNAKGNDRYGRNNYAPEDVTYKQLLELVQRDVYKYIPQRADVADGEYKVGDKVEYTHDGGRTWTDGIVAQPNDMGGIRIDTGHAPVMWVNATKDQLRHKATPRTQAKTNVDEAVKKAKADMAAKLEQVKDQLDEKILTDQIAQRDKFIDELDTRVGDGERIGTFAGMKNVDLPATLVKCIGERDALEEALDNLHTEQKRQPSTEDIADNPQSWVGKTFTYNGMKLVCDNVDKGYATFDNKTTYIGMGFDVSQVQGWLKSGKFKVVGEKAVEPKRNEPQAKSISDADIVKRITEHPLFKELVNNNPDPDGARAVLDGEILNKVRLALRRDGYIDAYKRLVTDPSFASKILDNAFAHREMAGEDYVQKAERIAKENKPKQDVKATPTPSERPKQTAKPSKSKKKVKPEQKVGDLFAGGLPDKEEDNNGLERNHDAVRTEGLPSDGGGNSRRGSVEDDRKVASQESGGSDGSRKGEGGRTRGEVPQSDRRPDGRLQGLGERKNVRNNHSERGVDHAPKAVNARIDANIKAIELAKQLLESGETATPEQMSVLRQFSGWGGLGAALSTSTTDWKMRERNQRIQDLLGKEAYDEAVMSANSAYYTPAYVVDTLWDVARQLGFKGGNILEGSAGIGNILGQMPMDMSDRSDIHAIEIDGTSGGILSLLYPDAKVDIKGFEQTHIPNGSVDLAITNVPFVTGLRVNDTTGDGDLSKKFHNIHDFCIAKNVRKLREGGLGIFITSNGTLDNSKKLRDWVVNEGGSDFVGAFRMNNQTFGGTAVTSDIIVIRKRVNGQKSANAIDVSNISAERTAEYQKPGEKKKKQLSMDYNKYFIEHPDHMAGEMHFAFEEGETFRPTSKGLYPVSGKDQGEMLQEFVQTLTAEEAGERASETEATTPNVYEDLGKDVKEGSMVVDGNGNICIAQYGKAVPVMSEPSKTDKAKGGATEEDLRKRFQDKKIKGHTKAECFKDYTAIKTALADVMKYQTENEGDAGLKPLIDKLNKAYDNFVAKYGHFNKNNQLAWLRKDVDYPNVVSLEDYQEMGDGKGGVTKTYGKADVMKHRVVEKENEPHPENVKDGVVVSMFRSGRIDVPYIAEQLGKSEADVKREIIESGLGFEDPTTKQMEVSYQYLSGNVREKLRQAEANNENGEYAGNIKALQDVVPMSIPAHLIDFTLGSSWLSPKLYEEYVKDRTDIDVKFTAVGGSWFMDEPYYVNREKNRAMGVVSEMLNQTKYGHELIEAAIQNKTLIVSKTTKHYDGTSETITDREATAACAAKIDEIRQDFKDWMRQKMQSDPEMSAKMEAEYNDRFNNYVPMKIPDEFVPKYFGGATHKFTMREHQGKAIVRGTMQPVMLAHEVGTGKTFTLISTAMEMRRLGTARKPMVVVQNATVGQFVASAKVLYPNAKILTLEDGDRNVEGRKNFYAKIKYNDWDMIVIPQSTFERIPDSDERQMAFIQSKIDEKIMVLEKMKEADAGNSNPVTRQAEREIESLRAEMAEMAENVAKKRTANDEKKRAVAKQNAAVRAQEMLDRKVDDVENFDDMGIDALLVDEAHEYKHLGFSTAMQRGVKGVDPSYSKKSQGVYLKTQAVLEKNHGRNVVFATGTPISNTAAEIWTFMRYLMPADTMKEYGIYYFDDFVRNFGNLQQMPEFNVSGKFKEVNRFAGYVNLPELVRIWSGVADTVLTKDQKELVDKIPEMEGGKAQDIYLPQTRALRSVMKFVRKQLEEFEQMSGKEKRENSHIPLTMYGIAQGAAVDARLVVSDAEDDPNSKTNEAVRQTLRSLKETDGYKGTVAIFADHYQNKQSGFNLYEDIKKKLIEQGVPENEIVVMKSGMTIKKKLDIFDKVNHGEVRVILGSTATLGTGVNIQERLHTLIHLDAPNRPMDYTQRNGRILRQGNLHKQWDKPVRVLRFGVEDSLDVTAYQRLKTKGAIADSIMEGEKLMKDSMNNRVLEEEEDVFGDTVAQLSGSEYALLKNNAEKNVRKYESRRRQWEVDQTYIHNAKPKLEGQIKAAEQRAEEAKAHLQAVKKAFPDGKADEITVGKKKFGTVESMADFIKEHNKKINDDAKAMKENPADDKHKHTLTLSMGGYDFVVNTELTRDVTRSGAGLFTEVHRVMTYSCPELGLEDVPVKQALIRNAIEDITENVITGNDFAERQDIAERSAKHGKSELEQLKSREGKPFEYSKELEEAERQLEEYTEAMKAELEEKEKKYAEMDASVEAATDVVIDDDEEDEDGDGDSASYRIVDDPALLNELEDGEWEEAYRVMQVIDGELYPPMAAVREGDLVTPIKLGLVEQAEEHPELITFDENGKPQFLLNKGQGKGSLKAAYNPYWHTSRTALNDQFSSAYIRPNLVVVRTLVPKSELTSGYRAQYAKDAVGEMSWHSGTVSGRLAELGKPRRVILSRYDKPMEIVPNAEVAKMIAEQLEGTDIAIPYNVVWPQLRDELEKLGVEISDEASGTVGEDTSFGKAEYVTDKMIAEMNEKAKRGMPRTPEAKRTEAERLGQKFNTPINIIEDTNAIVHTDPKIQARRRRAKGWYDTRTGEVTIVLPNNMNVEDVAETVFHETVGHKGLRELIGEKGYSEFLRTVYEHAKADVRRRIAKLAAKHNWDFEKATDEYLSKLAEKGFEDFDREERSMWQWLKEKVMKAIDKFLKTLKLPKWVKLGDNELRYMLWRSKERLERGKEDFVDMARDIVKREELGLGESARYKMGDAPETFKARQKRAVENKGTVMPGLNDAKVKVTDVPRHQYKGRDVITQACNAAIDRYSEKIDGKKDRELKLQHYDNNGTEFDYVISPKSVKEAANHVGNSDNIGVHIAVMDNLHEVINNSIEVEEHPDVLKKDGERKLENGFNQDVLMHRFVGAVRIAGDVYRVKTTMKEYKNPEIANGHYTYEVTKIEVLSETPNTSNGRSNVSDVFVSGAKLLQNVEKAYDAGKNILAESKKADEDTSMYREDGETDDIWKDGSMGLQERITAAATRLANNHKDNKTLRNDAMRAIGGNLTDLRKAMSLQRRFDVTTVKRVADLARVLMNGGYLNNLNQQEVKRLLAAVKNSTGHNDIEGDVQKVMDIMVDNQLKNAEATLHALESIKGTKVDARGVQVQGYLDADGAHVMVVFKKTRGWERSDIEDAMADAQQRMGRADVTVADEAALDYAGMQLALDYVENITGSKTEEADLRKEMKQAHDDANEDDRKTDSYRQYVDMMREAIRQNRIDRAQAYYDLVARMSGGLRESMAKANAFKEAEKARVRDIQHNANSDMEGRPSNEHYRPKAIDKFVNNSFVQYMFAPLGTFDQMLRLFGNKSANGEGYLYNRFMRGWVDARQKEIKGVRSKFAVLDAKAAELFGGKVKTWSDLIRKVGSLPKATVSFWNGGEMQDQELSQGNLMYIYMVNKMLDGRMKLRKMGISEDDVDAIEEALDPRLVELADWLQNEFLVDTRNEYNETHKRMFGTSMAAIENYFPLKILANARTDKAEDLDNPEKADGISTSTGSIIKRRRNALALDITGADALHVILDHVAQMEHWNAFAELNRDLNTLRTYKRFRNQVQNMTTIYGSGTELWKKFNTLCQMMAGTYRPPRAKFDEGAVNFAKGVTVAKVSFRVFTALKQFLSMPAYIPEARADYLLADIVNPVGAWKWCMANLSIFEERWKSRMAGDPRLMKSDIDWKMWRSRVMELASRWGMAPNAFVDAVTVAIGAHSMYKTRLAQYLRDGYDEETAERRANQDAEILYNQTQQSSEGPFTSTMQVDRSWLSVLFTVFRNSSMAYTRQLHDAVRNLKRNLTPGQRATSIEFMKKQMERDGIDEATAAASAGRKFRRQMTKDALRVATFGCIMQLAWNLGAYLPYLLFGDDDDTKDEFWKDVWTHTAFGWLEGFTGGDVMSQAGGMLLSGEGNPTNVNKDMPLTSDLMSVLKKFGNGKKAEAITDIVNIVVQSGIGVNPQSITDAVIGIMDACGDDPELAHEAAICVSRILQVPQSQIDKMYFDDVDLSGDEASKYTPAQLAERYARYEVKRGRLYAPLSWNDEEQKGKSMDKANTLIKERTEKMGDKKVNESYLRYEEVYNGVAKQVQAARKAAETDYVKAAEIMATLQKDPQTFATYQMFKQTDSMYDKIAKLYMGAKTPEEASLCLRTMVDFKAKMVDALDNVGTDKAGQAMQRLGAVMQDFSQRYAAMQPNR